MGRQQRRPTDQSERTLQEVQEQPPSRVRESTLLLVQDSLGVTTISNTGSTTTDSNRSSNIRARRAQSKSPSSLNQHLQQGQQVTLPQATGETTALTSSNQQMYQATAAKTHDNGSSSSNHNHLEGGPTTEYTEITYHASASARGGSQHGDLDSSSHHSHHGNLNSRSSLSTRSSHIPIRRAGTASLTRGSNSHEELDHDLTHSESNPPLLEIPEEIYAVRKAALQVLKPLTRTWVRLVEIGEGGFPRFMLLRLYFCFYRL
jgi:hypothetical protein